MYSFFLEIKFQIAILSYDITPFLSLILFYFIFIFSLAYNSSEDFLSYAFAYLVLARSAAAPMLYSRGIFPKRTLSLKFPHWLPCLKKFLVLVGYNLLSVWSPSFVETMQYIIHLHINWRNKIHVRKSF